MKIVLLEPLGISGDALEALCAPLTAAGHEFTAWDSTEPSVSGLIRRAEQADVLMLANHPLPGQVIRACPQLRYISVAFVGIDHIDQNACLERSIPVSNAAAYCTHAVAELELGLCLACLRSICVCDRVVRQGGTSAGLVGHQLFGRTVGIIGTGNTGCEAARLYKAFGCRVLGCSRHVRRQAEAAGVEYVPMETLLHESDIVSLHTPLTEQTAGLLNAERLAMMKPGAILINTARGGIVDVQATAQALKSGRLAAYGTDVYELEPPLPADYPLWSAPHVVATPHVAFATEESLENRAKLAFENVAAWLDGKLLRRML